MAVFWGCFRLPEFLASVALLALLALRQTNHQYATNTWRHLFLCYKDMPKNLDKNNGENLHIFWTNWGISMKFSGQMWLLITLKVTKNQGFTLSLKLYFWKNHRGRGSNWPHLSRLRVKGHFCKRQQTHWKSLKVNIDSV